MLYFLIGLGGLAVGFVGGYITCNYWGKPAKLLKKIEARTRGGLKELLGE